MYLTKANFLISTGTITFECFFNEMDVICLCLMNI